MKLEHLGDAFDHWKGSVIVRSREALREIHVLPMFTDPEPESVWSRDRIVLYAALIGVAPERVVLTDRRFPGGLRRDYFNDARLHGDFDLLVDPDTGIAPPSGGDSRHIRSDELESLLGTKDRVVLVYQHSGRTEKKGGALRRLTEIRRLFPHGFAVWAGEVSMFCLSRSERRSRRVRRVMERWLGPCAEGQDGCPGRLLLPDAVDVGGG